MKDDDVINVYWSPVFPMIEIEEKASAMFYKEPSNLFTELSQKRKNFKGFNTFFACPVTKNRFKNTFVFKNSLKADYEYKTYDNGVTDIFPNGEFNMPVTNIRKPSLTVGPLLVVDTPFIFFADEDVEALLSQPTFHKAGYTRYGSIVPGRFNIGSWFRPYICEIQMWENNGRFLLEEDEPIFYLELLTDKKINLIRFSYNKELEKLAQHCIDSPKLFGKHLPITKRYKRFKESNMKNIILLEIKKNLVDKHE
jgi:hypothetical protein